MTYGPIDFVVLEFEGNKFSGEILASLLDLIQKEIIRVIDLVVVVKDKEGNVTVRELLQFSPEMIAIFEPLSPQVTGMITTLDTDMVALGLGKNSTAAVMLFENLWAIGFKEAAQRANGRVVMQERIPEEVIVEALIDMAQLGSEALDVPA